MTACCLPRWVLLLLILTFTKQPLLSGQTLRVDEEKTRLEVIKDDLELRLAVVNSSTSNTQAHIDLRFLSTTDTVAGSVVRDAVAKPGANEFKFHLAGILSKFKDTDRELLPWFRLQYRVSTGSTGDDAHGIISASTMIPKTFQIGFGALRRPVGGEAWAVHVFTQQPNSNIPVRDVDLTATLTITRDERETVMAITGHTGPAGRATLTFKLPADLDGADLSLIVKGKRGNEIRQASDDFNASDNDRILLSTDKPMYQPGQDLHIRILAFDRSGSALIGKTFQVEISDPEGVTASHVGLVTSHYGEAHMDWAIPNNARLGNYSINIRQKDDRVLDGFQVKVSRYDLPNFAVKATPDQPYYVAGQNAEIEIQSDYLFGQPVSRAHVRVLEEKAEGLTVAAGESDDRGRFVAKIDLEKKFPQLIEQDSSRSRDLGFVAYATDPTTNRTEERHFGVRLTRDPIHIYVGTPHSLAKGLPTEFFVATQFADGRPVESQVEIWLAPTDAEGIDRQLAFGTVLGASPITVVRTNRLGVAQVHGIEWDQMLANATEDRLHLLLRADDGYGKRGAEVTALQLNDSAIHVYTDKIAYAAGDPIQVRIRSTYKTGPLVLDLVKGRTVIQTLVVPLINGLASATFQNSTRLQGGLQIFAHYAGGDDDSDNDGARSVNFPDDSGLHVEVRPEKPLYVPGTEATVSLHIRNDKHSTRESLLGIVVVDRAVAERAQSVEPFFSKEDSHELTERELAGTDRSVPIPDDLNLAADYMLNAASANFSTYGPRRFSYADIQPPESAFREWFQMQFAPLLRTLQSMARNGKYLADEASLNSALSEAGFDRNPLLDPWGNPFHISFSGTGFNWSITARGAGPDKRLGSGDDFEAFRFYWPYFRPRGEILNRSILNYREHTGEFVRNMTSLKSAMLQEGVDFDSWQDPWGHPYRYTFSVYQTRFIVSVRSGGPNGEFEVEGARRSDDTLVWTTAIEYTSEIRRRLQHAVNRYYQESKNTPETPLQLDRAIQRDGIADSTLTDPWGRRFYSFLGKSYEYTDDLLAYFMDDAGIAYSEYLELQRQRTDVVPVSREIQILALRSAGPDGIEGTPDDFEVAHFSRLLAEQSANSPMPNRISGAPLLNGTDGAIHGIVTDGTGARIPGTQMFLASSGILQREIATNDRGEYVFDNLTSGYYDVRFELPGFRSLTIRDVPVGSGVTELNAILQLGSGSLTMVDVSSDASTGSRSFLTSTSVGAELVRSNGSKASRQVPGNPAFNLPVQTSTPRLREYFPETLVWQPALETDRNGNAQLRFKLADNITEWKVQAIASTVDGRIAYGETPLLSYQPFFLEHDPPRVLTEGDRIVLPVVIRSYLDKDQSLDLSMKPETWFTSSDSLNKKADVRAGETIRSTFDFKASASIKDGKQRITAIGTAASDSIEKPVTVHPDGRELAISESRVYTASSVFEINLPLTALPNTARAELKIYPNLMAHVVDAIEGIMQRPAGCAEQVISSSYPSLFLLRENKRNSKISGPLVVLAKKYLESGYAKLVGFQSSDGGFTYWGSGKPDIAVTAYAIDFLQDAKGLIEIDEAIIGRAQSWLSLQQHPDGSWARADSIEPENPASVLTLTSFVARVLSKSDLKSDAAAKALKYVRERAAQWGEPYSLSSFALASLNRGDRESAKWAIAQFERTIHKEGDSSFWDLQTNTPFFGWGVAGRLETTALCVRALAEAQAAGIADVLTQSSIDRGLLFLLHNKDRYGVWYSTQATVRVVDALVRLIGADSGKVRSEGNADVIINGVRVDTIRFPRGQASGLPMTMDLSRFLRPGSNRVELRGSGSTGKATAQIIETYYVPWSEAVTPADALRLNVRFDKTEGKAGDEITCIVDAERVGFRGYGMMLAEIGLPPGTDVDRASLEKAVNGSDSVFRYEVLPDRIVLYFWPRAGGAQFQFKFRVRFALDAQTAASTLYDYYNPDELAVAKPTRFVIQ